MLDAGKRKRMLRQMVLVRAFEEKLEELYQRKAMFGSTHSYRGQEAIAVGVCSALQSADLIASYHRGTGHLIAKGADLYLLLCECMGRADGYSKGRAKSRPITLVEPKFCRSCMSWRCRKGWWTAIPTSRKNSSGFTVTQSGGPSAGGGRSQAWSKLGRTTISPRNRKFFKLTPGLMAWKPTGMCSRRFSAIAMLKGSLQKQSRRKISFIRAR